MRRPASTGLALVAATAVVTALAACTAAGPGAAPRSSAPAPASAVAVPAGTPEDVATGLDAPWEVALLDGTPLISLRDSGEVLELLDDGSTRRVGTVPDVRAGGEAGLLGMAAGPDGSLYTYSTATDGNRIERFALEGGPGSYALGAEDTILDGLPASSFHDGGRIAFGPDGMLYASVGDAGDGPAAQDRDVLAGKILRMTPDGGVPGDNPFGGSLVYSLGHRNVQGLGWSSDGTMFAAEFGQDAWDELNVIRAGADYGWPQVEGMGAAGDDPDLVDPVQVWPTDEASPSGLAVVGDTVFVANLRGEMLRAIPAADPGTSRELFAGDFGRLRSVLQGPDGDLWFTTSNTDGRGRPRGGDDRILRVPLREATA